MINWIIAILIGVASVWIFIKLMKAKNNETPEINDEDPDQSHLD